MNKILLFLSTFNPRSTLETYECPDGSKVEGIQSCDAPVKYLLQSYGKEIEEIVLILTKEAKNNGYTQFHDMVTAETKRLGFSLTITEVDYNTADENFHALALENMVQALNGGEKILIDATGGFRDYIIHLLLSIQVLSYKNMEYEVIYSNLGDKKIKYLDHSVSLFQMVTGMQEFLNTGSVTTLRKFYGPQPEDEKIGNLLTAIETLNDGIALCSVDHIEKRLFDFNKAIQEAKTANDPLFVEMLSTVQEQFGENMELPDLIVWCAEHGMVQQALTICDELMPGFLLQHLFSKKPRYPSVKYSTHDNPERVLFQREFLKLYHPEPKYNEYRRNHPDIPEFCRLVSQHEEAIMTFTLENQDLSAVKPSMRESLFLLQRYLKTHYQAGVRNEVSGKIDQNWKKETDPIQEDYQDTFKFIRKCITRDSFSNQVITTFEYEKSTKLLNFFLDFSINTNIETIEHLETLLPDSVFEISCEIDDLKEICQGYIFLRALRNCCNHASESVNVEWSLYQYFKRVDRGDIRSINTVAQISEILKKYATFVKKTKETSKNDKTISINPDS